MMSLALIWLVLIAFIIIMYIILDGFTLGIGLLLPWISDHKDRDIVISTVLPVWDGNETWLVFAGAALYGAFPLAFSILLPILYLPITLMIIGLLLRGIAFEFRFKSNKTKLIWDICLSLGSLSAVVAQGIVVGIYAQGFKTDLLTGDIHAIQGANWFSFFCAGALLLAYALLGSDRLIKKTKANLQEQFMRISQRLQWLVLATLIFIGIYSPLTKHSQFHLWFDLKNSPFMFIFPILIIIFITMHYWGLVKRIVNLPFAALLAVFITAYIGFISSNLPYLIPNELTFMDAKADDGALLFMLFGAIILIPLLLFYTAYTYRLFHEPVHHEY